MKKVVLIAVLLVLSPKSSTGSTVKHRCHIIFGPSITITDMTGYAGSGLDGGVGYYYRISRRVDVGINTSAYKYNGGTSKVDLTGVDIIPSLRLNTAFSEKSRMNLYLQLGTGYSYHKKGYPVPLIPPSDFGVPDKNEETFGEQVVEIGAGVVFATQRHLNVEFIPTLRFGIGNTEVVTHLSIYWGLVIGW